MRAPFASHPRGGDGKAEVYVLSEQEKQIGRSVFENGPADRFPSPLALDGDPVAMDVADLDGDKSGRDRLSSRAPKPGVRFVRAAGVTRERSRRAQVEEVGRRSRRWNSRA